MRYPNAPISDGMVIRVNPAQARQLIEDGGALTLYLRDIAESPIGARFVVAAPALDNEGAWSRPRGLAVLERFLDQLLEVVDRPEDQRIPARSAASSASMTARTRGTRRSSRWNARNTGTDGSSAVTALVQLTHVFLPMFERRQGGVIPGRFHRRLPARAIPRGLRRLEGVRALVQRGPVGRVPAARRARPGAVSGRDGDGVLRPLRRGRGAGEEGVRRGRRAARSAGAPRAPRLGRARHHELRDDAGLTLRHARIHREAVGASRAPRPPALYEGLRAST